MTRAHQHVFFIYDALAYRGHTSVWCRTHRSQLPELSCSQALPSPLRKRTDHHHHHHHLGTRAITHSRARLAVQHQHSIGLLINVAYTHTHASSCPPKAHDSIFFCTSAEGMLIIHTMHTFVRVIPSRVSRVCLRHRAIACWMRSTSSVTSGGGGAGAHAPYVGPFKSGSCGKPSTSCAAWSASVVGWCAPSNTHPIYSSLLAPRVLVRSLSLCAPALGRTTNHAAKSKLRLNPH